MLRLNLFLLLGLVVCALGTVTSQHKARKLFQEAADLGYKPAKRNWRQANLEGSLSSPDQLSAILKQLQRP